MATNALPIIVGRAQLCSCDEGAVVLQLWLGFGWRPRLKPNCYDNHYHRQIVFIAFPWKFKTKKAILENTFSIVRTEWWSWQLCHQQYISSL